jgi:uncharacterized radical SAM superfamily Fe-S cluster-containing enzyme
MVQLVNPFETPNSQVRVGDEVIVKLSTTGEEHYEKTGLGWLHSMTRIVDKQLVGKVEALSQFHRNDIARVYFDGMDSYSFYVEDLQCS